MSENEKNHRVTVVLGMTGEGKTTKAKELALEFPRRIYLDTNEEYDGTIVRSYSDFDAFIRAHNNDESFSLCCRFDFAREYEGVVEAAWWIGNVCLIAEECEAYISPRDPDSPMNRIINRGRHRNVSVIAIGRRQTELSRVIRAQGTRFISFRQNLPQDIEEMERLGLNVGSLGPHEFCELTI